jgi:chromate reductase
VAGVKLLGIPGSLRQASLNRFALRAAQSVLPPGTSLDIFELEGIPPYNQDQESSRRPASSSSRPGCARPTSRRC